MYKMCHIIAIIAIFLIYTPAYAVVYLFDIYQQALNYEPIFRAAQSDYMAATKDIPIARSSLLPVLAFQGSINEVNNEQSFIMPFINNSGNGNFTQQTYEVYLKQPLFNYKAWKQLRAAKAGVKAAFAHFNSEVQELIIRVSQSYFNVLEGEDLLRMSRAEKRANYQRMLATQERYKFGLDTITAVYRTQAAYGDSIASEIEAQNRLINYQQELSKLTDNVYTDLARLQREIPLKTPSPDNVEDWIDISTMNNYHIIENKYLVEEILEQQNSEKGGYYPEIDANVNYNFNDGTGILGGVDNTPVPIGTSAGRIKSQTAALGISVNFPLLQGGLVSAKVQQAHFKYESAQSNLENTYRNTIVETKKTYNDIVFSIMVIEANKQTIKFAKNGLDSAEMQYKLGTNTITDVFDAQKTLFDAKKEYFTHIYQYILSTLHLKLMAGSLGAEDIQQINDWLYDPPEALKAEYAIRAIDNINIDQYKNMY